MNINVCALYYVRHVLSYEVKHISLSSFNFSKLFLKTILAKAMRFHAPQTKGRTLFNRLFDTVLEKKEWSVRR